MKAHIKVKRMFRRRLLIDRDVVAEWVVAHTKDGVVNAAELHRLLQGGGRDA